MNLFCNISELYIIVIVYIYMYMHNAHIPNINLSNEGQVYIYIRAWIFEDRILRGLEVAFFFIKNINPSFK